MTIKITNNATTTIAVGITAADTSISLAAGTGALFPTLTTGDYFYAVLEDAVNNYEIIKVTARAGDVLTVARAQEGTTALAFSAGSLIDLRMTAQTFYDYIASTVGTATVDQFTGTGAQVAFTLSVAPTAIQQLVVTVGGVVQTPTTDYTVSGTTLTFTSAPASGLKVLVFQFNPTSVATGGLHAANNLSDVADAGTARTNLGLGTSSSVTFGNLGLSASGARITGDFSNATHANRVMFQTSTANGNTSIQAIPNGTGTTSQFIACAKPDPDNSSRAVINTDSTQMVLSADKTGTGTYLPMTFYTGGSERMRIDTSGNVGIGRAPSYKFDVYQASGSVTAVTAVGGSTGTDLAASNVTSASGTNYIQTALYGTGQAYTITNGTQWVLGTYSNSAILFYQNSTEAFRVDTSKNVLVTGSGGLGYGTGSGGTVTQATSKSTSVTLNKPTGRITTAADALAANTAVYFTVNNSLVSASDNVVITLQNGDAAGGSYVYGANLVSAGSFIIYIRNMTAVSRSEALVLNYAIIKGATA